MKNLKFLLTGIIIMVILSSCGAASAERKAIKKAQEQQVALNVEKSVKEKEIDILINKILPLNYPSRTTQQGYFLKIKGDILDCHLPYFGVARTATLGTEEQSIKIEKKKIVIAEDFSKKGEYLLFFKTYSGKDLWEITVQIYDNGKVNIGCSSNSKDYISYMGDLQNIW